MSEMKDAIKALVEDKGYSLEQVKMIIEGSLKSAYKKTYGTDENARVEFTDDLSDVALYSKKVVVDTAYNEATEIELVDAQKLADEVEIGDEIDIPIDPKTLNRAAISVGKQSARTELTGTMKETLLSQFNQKVGTVLGGICQKISQNSLNPRDDGVIIDIGVQLVEGFMPKSLENPNETYEVGENIKCVLERVRTTREGIKLILSRASPLLVQQLMEKEVPELASGAIKIEKAVREAGFRTKIALSSMNENIDAVGSCVGPRGVRIQAISRELLGEKIDVLPYSDDPATFIKNSLSPARVERVVLLDEGKKEALAIVEDEMFSLAIGSRGLNVRLASRLSGWTIDVKPQSDAAAMDLSEKQTTKAALELFSSDTTQEETGITLKTLPDVNTDTLFVLEENGVKTVEDFVMKYNEGELYKIGDLDKDEIDDVYNIIAANYDIENDEEEDEGEFVCPNCGEPITADMTKCPKCGAEFEFEEE